MNKKKPGVKFLPVTCWPLLGRAPAVSTDFSLNQSIHDSRGTDDSVPNVVTGPLNWSNAALTAAIFAIRAIDFLFPGIVELYVLGSVAVILEASFDFAIVFGCHLNPEFVHKADVLRQKRIRVNARIDRTPDAMTFVITGAADFNRDIVINCLTCTKVNRPALS